MKTKTLITPILFLSIAGCTWVGTRKEINIFDRNNSVNVQSSFYLNYPKNGFQKEFITKRLVDNPDSAREVVGTFRNILSEKFGQLSINERNLNLEEAFKEAGLRGNRYLINIEIAQWKDAIYLLCAAAQNHNGQYNEPASMDTVDLTIYIYEVKTKELLNKQKIFNSGCPIVIAGAIPIGKNSPSSRLSAMLESWLNNLK